MATKRLLLLGDFIRIAYQPRVDSLLASMADLDVEVVGPAASSGSSRDLAEHVTMWLDRFRPDALHFNAGLEDVLRLPGEDQNQVTVGEYGLNLQRVLDVVTPRLGGDVIFATTTPVDEASQEDAVRGSRLNRDIDAYNAVAQEMMLAQNILINHLDRVIGERDQECLASNGVSLRDEGCRVAAKATIDAVQTLWHT